MFTTRHTVATSLVLVGLALGSAGITHANTINVPDGPGNVGGYTSMVIGTDGNPIISYYDWDQGNLKVLDCHDSTCNSGHVTTFDSLIDMGMYTSIVLGTDGNPYISYYDVDFGDLMLADCHDPGCTTATVRTLDSGGDVGRHTSIALGHDGFPVISYHDASNGDLKVYDCHDAACSTGTATRFVTPFYVDGRETSIVIGNDGRPVVSHYDSTFEDLMVTRCVDVACTTPVHTTADEIGNVGRFTSIVLGTDGNPIVAYHDVTNGDLKVLDCHDVGCTVGATTTVPHGFGVGQYTSMVLGGDGNPIIAYYDHQFSDLMLTECHNPGCTNSTWTTLDEVGDVGLHTSIALGTDGEPVIAYHDRTNGDLNVLKVGDPPRTVTRVSGASRLETAIDASQASFANDAAGAVVLARADLYPDALVGGPLAALVNAPLLLTRSDSLPSNVLAEIHRVLTPGDTVHVLGGTAAISNAVTGAINGAGYTVARYAGSNRYETATRVADAMVLLGGDARTALLASGTNFPDALAASAAGARHGHPVLLTDDDRAASATSTWLAIASPTRIVCAGGPACRAYPGADTVLIGTDRYQTATLVADAFFVDGTPVGVASGVVFPDALVAAADTPHRGGPLVLTRPTSLPTATANFVDRWDPDLITVYGGTAAVSAAVAQQLAVR